MKRMVLVATVLLAGGAPMGFALTIPAWDGNTGWVVPPGALIEWNQATGTLFAYSGAHVWEVNAGWTGWTQQASGVDGLTAFDPGGCAFDATGAEFMLDAGWGLETRQTTIASGTTVVKSGLGVNFFDAGTHPVSGQIFATWADGWGSGNNNRIVQVSLAGNGSTTDVVSLPTDKRPDNDGTWGGVASGGLGFDAAGNLYMSRFEYYDGADPDAPPNHLGYIDIYQITAADLADGAPYTANLLVNDLLGAGSGQLVVGGNGMIYLMAGPGVVGISATSDPDSFTWENLAGDFQGDAWGPWLYMGLTTDQAGQILYYGEWEGSGLQLRSLEMVPEPGCLLPVLMGVLFLRKKK